MGVYMRLSEILEEMSEADYNIYEEKDFLNMSLLLPNRSEQDRCVFLMEKKYLKKLNSSIKMVITKCDLAKEVLSLGIGVCISSDPRLLFFKIHNFLSTNNSYLRDNHKTIIGENCSISSSASIPSENVIIGNNVTIEDKVVILGHVNIGDGSIIHCGSVIGACGNDFKRYGDHIIRTAHVGGVIIGENVEIDPNCCIERPMFSYEDTKIGNEVKIGALSFLAHGAKIGERTQLKGMVNLAGYVTIGNDVFIGPGVTISNLVNIDDEAHITIGSVVVSNVKKGGHVTGNFAIEHNKFMEHQLSIFRE